ncbi:MAG: hypothetical protein SGARI_003004, partial [Bacillariaceae sp.]
DKVKTNNGNKNKVKTVVEGPCKDTLCPNGKEMVCHLPGGNPLKAKKKCVKGKNVLNFLEAHPANYCGECQVVPEVIVDPPAPVEPIVDVNVTVPEEDPVVAAGNETVVVATHEDVTIFGPCRDFSCGEGKEQVCHVPNARANPKASKTKCMKARKVVDWLMKKPDDYCGPCIVLPDVHVVSDEAGTRNLRGAGAAN